jgi:eukaryotic-like serine/threonine-protein kinase
MARGILAGLEYLHARKIIHRDLKPANILLQGKTPRIADFGISRVLKSASLSAVMAGTPVYMAPEAFRCKRNEQTDLWSAGVILYQLLSGRLPFAGHDPAEVMWAITDEEAAPLPASMPDWVRQAVATVLAKDPAARFKTAEQMGAALVEPRIAPLPKPQPAPSASTVLVDPTTIVRPVDRKPTPVSPEKMVWAPHFTENLNGVPLEMILVPGGKFKMGSPAGEEYDNTKPQHDVIVPAFYVGKFPVTQAQWQAVMGSNPSYFKGNDRPVEGVSWYDVKEFCQKLSQLSDKPYRLPSEAEWEYACRGGTTGDDAGDIYEMAWYGENSSFKTHPVGQKKPNSFGLYDMHGNVWEWCEDVWHKNYLGAPTDGSAWLSGGDFRVRVIRGGSWGSSEEYCRAAPRHYLHRGNCDQYRGLRVVMSARTQ